jgi:nucleotide-binding universal stress UspA family protein
MDTNVASPSIASGRKVLACVDSSAYAQFVADWSIWIAGRMGAPLEFFHALASSQADAAASDLSGAIGVDAKEGLLEHLASIDESKRIRERTEARQHLEKLRSWAFERGLNSVDIRLRHGDLVEAIAEQHSDVRLYVLGRRGESEGQGQRDIGRNLERVIRSLHRPVLAVHGPFHEPTHAVFAFDGSFAARNAVEMIAKSPVFHGIEITIAFAGERTASIEKSLMWASAQFSQSDFRVATTIVGGNPATAIAALVSETGANLLMMGAYSHSWFRSLFAGSRTNRLLRASQVPVVMVR